MRDDSGSDPLATLRVAAHRSSWINWLSTKVEKLPGPGWAYYTAFWVAFVALQAAILWAEGADIGQSYHPAQAFLAGALAFLLGMFSFLDRRAVSALRAIHPVLRAKGKAYARLESRMTNLPPVGSVISFLLALGIVHLSEVFGGRYQIETLAGFPISHAFLRIIYLSCWGVFGAFIYQTMHRLSLIQTIYSKLTLIDLFRRQPLYALSNLMAISAASLTILPIGFLMANRLTDLNQLDPVSILVVGGIEAIAFISFLWPQLGIRRLQRDAKGQLIDEVNRRYQKALSEFHQRIDQGELERTQDLDLTLAILERELKHVKAIPIWPWDPETLRWLITALILPLGLMILQLVLGQIIG